MTKKTGSKAKKSNYVWAVPIVVAIIAGIFALLEKIIPSPPPPSVNTPTASPSSVISFQDFEKENGTPGDYFQNAWFVICDLSTSNVYQGERALHCQAQAKTKGDPQKDTGGTVAITPSQNRPVDLSHFDNLFVSVYDAQGGNTLQLVLWDRDGHRSNEVWSEMSTIRAKWTEISWNLKNFIGIEPSQIKYLEIYTSQDGDYYFDAAGAN